MALIPYTIYLSEEELGRFNGISAYEYMGEASSQEVFTQALYPIYNYYKKRTPNVAVYSTPKDVTENENTLTVIETENSFILLRQKFFPQKNIVYLNKREALLDVERTWEVLSVLINQKEYKQVNFSMMSWTKMAYAYRLNCVYGLEIVDITLY